MSQPKTRSKSPRQIIADVQRQIEQTQEAYSEESRGVEHLENPNPRTVMHLCLPGCPACAIRTRYSLILDPLGKQLRAALVDNARSSLRSAAGLAKARAAARPQSITPRKYASAKKRAKHDTQKELASLLKVTQPTLRAYQRTIKKV